MKKIKVFLFLFAVSALFFAASFSPEKSDEQKIEALISSMTLDEKLAFIGGYNSFNIRPIERLGIPEIRFADGPVGVRNYGRSTAYPASIALAAAFDKDISYKVGKAIASEARAKNIHVMLGPAMNIHRGPFCGRNFEYLGEDPYLAGQIAAAYTRGMQDEGVMATAKHYAANYQDFNRHVVSSDMDERTLHEIYLPAFKITVQEGKAASVMTSYNLINGIHASQHDYLNNKILKDEWAFDGFIMSDWNSTYDGIACVNGGLDLEMPAGKFMNPDTMRIALENGKIDIATIDDKIRRILRMYFRFGYMQNPDISKGYVLDSVSVRNVAIEAARGGTVLLKNEKNFLPLDKTKIKSIAVIGPNGDPAVTGGGGSAFVRPKYPVSMFEAIKTIAGPSVEVKFEKGAYNADFLPRSFFWSFQKFYYYDNEQKKPGAIAEFFGNTELKGDVIYSKTLERLNMSYNHMLFPGVPQENFSIRFKCFFTPEETGHYLFGMLGDDGYRLYIDGKKVVDKWQEQSETITKYFVDLEAGKEYKIELEYFQAGGDASIRMAAALQTGKELTAEETLNNALQLAKNSDLVVMCTGFNNETEGEGFDRSFEMPFNQSELIKKISAVNPNTIVVLNAGGNVDMLPWINNVKGLVHAWYPGQEGSLAVAEILFGITNPSGKLPVSFESKWEDNPTFNSYFDNDKDEKVYFSEGIFVGYRHYDKSAVKPMFPFGYGLSYTSFAYTNASVDKSQFTVKDVLKVKVDVKNTGKFDGAESVQLYVSDKISALPRPIKELKDFGKVSLKKGETKTLEFELDKDAFSYYNPELHQWVAEPGDFTILLGSSSADIRQEIAVKLVE